MQQNGHVTSAPGDASQLPARVPRAWSSSIRTRQLVLDSARDLFSERGYESTGINDIVARSGVSVGSIYHHIGGKAEIFNELAAIHSDENRKASRTAVDEARAAGESDPVELFVAGARAFLLSVWADRSFSRILLGNDQPVSYAEIQRELSARLMRGARGLTAGSPPTPDASTRAILALLKEGAIEVAAVEDLEQATALADYFVLLVRTMTRS